MLSSTSSYCVLYNCRIIVIILHAIPCPIDGMLSVPVIACYRCPSEASEKRIIWKGPKGLWAKGLYRKSGCDTSRNVLNHIVFGPLPNGPLVPSESCVPCCAGARCMMCLLSKRLQKKTVYPLVSAPA